MKHLIKQTKKRERTRPLELYQTHGKRETKQIPPPHQSLREV